MKPLIINLFGAPGAGKSTGAAYIFSKLKMSNLNIELVTEYPKDKTWECNNKALSNQVYIFGMQYYKITRCEDKVDIIITDSPLPLTMLYLTDESIRNDLNSLVMNIFNQYENINILLERDKPYNPIGRMQTEEESNIIYKKIVELLNKNNIIYKKFKGNEENYDNIVEYIKNYIKLRRA